MNKHTTVRKLIENLKMIENQDAPVIYQYYIGEHFDVSDENFAKVADEFDSCIPCSHVAYNVIAETVADLVEVGE